MRKTFATVLLAAAAALSANAQEQERKGEFSGNFQLDAQTYVDDSITGAVKANESMLMNAYGNLNYTYGNLSAGMRFEAYLNTMQGIDSRFDGTGVPYKYVRYKNEELEFTVGNFYEQFGNGLTLRAYEEKTLGIDNAFEGVLVRHRPHNGITLKGLVGKQRDYMSLGDGIVRGIDGEVSINDALGLDSAKTIVSVGGSFVSKYQADQDPLLLLPENVAAFAGRLNAQRGGVNLNTEYAYKFNDPSVDNGFNYQDGQVLMADLSYTAGAFGVVAGAKWLNNMSFRSERGALNNDLLINYIPTITKNHTYSFAAMYPYVTQLKGEAGVKGEIFYRFKKGTALGGKYGTVVSLSYSRVNTIDTTNLPNIDATHPHWDRYTTRFLSVGPDRLYEDLSLDITKKVTRNLSTFFSAQYNAYNKQLIEGKDGTIESLIFIGDVTYKLRPKHALRVEGQLLFTEQDMGNWAALALEYTVSPHWFVSVVDQFNYGNPSDDHKLHYYMARAGYTRGANRIALGYGRQRQGVICVGGVCRVVPASTGFNISITSTF